ncbi:hypothetical protein IVB33_30235 [Bradyrhizobium sp. 24]|uniref:hypothetical protein n=1 Tax=unclassified Bradyrhizobium TaxID=2631580 RepID=UPI001FFB4805|nr:MULTISPECIES: hypothetical protein [unclassified Bradyrhizobium]MCK1297519.1 hypothetical protein [Bradyrhizobium sp. 37]MCK1381172.1 hypothetical protein [Bradyrhizobium sp. 24]MCK1770923.1 hypothetical protein [Bradyrhizobium sp. 134]
MLILKLREAALTVFIAVVSIFPLVSEGIGQSDRLPREPLEPGARARQYPAGLANPAAIPVNAVTVSNFGDATLAFSASDGKSKWRQFRIAPGETVAVSCADCRESISLAFNDGSSNRVTPISLGKRYALYWLTSANRWDISTFQDLEASGALTK